MATMGPRVQRLHRCRPHRPAGDLILDQLAYETLKECPDAATLLDDGWTRSNYDPNLHMEDLWKADFDESQYSLSGDYYDVAISKVAQDLNGCYMLTRLDMSIDPSIG